MPPSRTLQLSQFRFSNPSKPAHHNSNDTERINSIAAATDEDAIDLTECDVNYPEDESDRRAFRTKTGKVVTAHQWAVYDFVRKIPLGKVTTYKDICVSLGQGSPRSVGVVLSRNPFAPRVPCHRVVASNFYIGGFFGEWGPNSGSGKQSIRKMEMLAREGVEFDSKGFLCEKSSRIWRG